MDRFDCDYFQSIIRAKSFFVLSPLSSGKKCRRREPKRAIFASQRGSVSDFLGLKAQLIDDDVLGTGDNFTDSDAFCEAQGFIGSLGRNDEHHADPHVEDLIHLVHRDIP